MSTEEQERIEWAEAWVAEVERAYADGGYAHGDGPELPLDTLKWLLDERRKALGIIEGWHQFSNHLDRIVEASPHMRVVDASAYLEPERERLRKLRAASAPTDKGN